MHQPYQFTFLFRLLLDKTSGSPSWRLSECYVILYKSILMLGSNVRVDSLHKRISFLSMLFAGLLLYWLWEAQLISYFSFPVKSLPFNNMEEFLEKSDDKVPHFPNINELKEN